MYSGSRLRWHLRRPRRVVHPLVAAVRHRRYARSEDRYLVSYPRSGSTWCAFMLADLILGRDPSFQEAHDAVPELPDASRAPAARADGGRILRTHEMYRREYDESLYLVRDPRDVAVSYFRYRFWLREFSGDLAEFIHLFLRGRVDAYGRWDEHVRSWLDAPRSALVIRYEDLVAQPHDSLARAAHHAGVAASSGDIDRAVRDNDLVSMRQKEAAVTQDHFRSTDPRYGSFVRGTRTDSSPSLDPDDRARIEASFGETMHALGYVTDY